MKDRVHISVSKKSEFQGGPRVAKMIKNTQCYIYIYGLQCDFLQKIQRHTRKIKINRARFAQTFSIGMVYFRFYLVNPHVQAAQNMYGKGG